MYLCIVCLYSLMHKYNKTISKVLLKIQVSSNQR